MGLYPILLVAIVLAADADPRLTREVGEIGFGGRGPASGGWSIALSLGPIALILALAGVAMWWCRRRVDSGQGPGGIIWADRIARGTRSLLLLQHAAAVFVFGWVGAVRSVVDDPVLIDELVAITPPLLGVLGTWWLYYPMEQRLREALLIRRLDAGQPIYPMPSRSRYVFVQARIHLLFLLVPVLLIVACSEAIDALAPRVMPEAWPGWWADVTKVGAALLVFVAAPLLARMLLDVTPLAPGPLREDLLEICRRHRVRIRDILVWNTSGMMINAAVMGMVAPLRYVLITDALLESMTRPEVRAVMVHEVAHVRRHHIPWMAATLIAIVLVSSLVIDGSIIALDVLGVQSLASLPEWAPTAAAAAHVGLALAMFGWVSRRLERQADAFAVQHLSGAKPTSAGAGADGSSAGTRVTDEAVEAMSSALATIARLNAVPPRRRSWRHGSIAWRREYLRSLVGQPIARLAIDRHVGRIKAAAAVALLAGLALMALESTGRTSGLDMIAPDNGAGDDTWEQPPQP